MACALEPPLEPTTSVLTHRNTRHSLNAVSVR